MSPRAEVFQGTERFSVVRVVGTGGMGVVYEVFDRERRRAVALKTLRDIDATSLYRFKHEFRALADITHPHLIPLYELFADDQHWFFTMELVERATDFLSYIRRDLHDSASSSETATETIASGTVAAMPSMQMRGADAGAAPGPAAPAPDGAAAIHGLDPHKLRGLLGQLADAVTTLHEAGKLHRDLKPRNVLVRPDGHVFVVDLGLVADLSQQPSERGSSASGSGSSGTGARIGNASGSGSGGSQARVRSYYSTNRKFAGTVAYMSPEQAARAPLTPASDWYAVGVMLFQALTGRLPFEGITAQVLHEKQHRDAPRVRDFAPDAADDLVSLCERLLRRDASARPTGPDVLAELGVARVRPVKVAGRLIDDLPFVGREAQLATLAGAFEAAQGDLPVVCRVHGRSGAGKSTLLARFLVEIEATRDAVILTGRCYEQESVPFKAVDSLVDALTRYLMTLGRDDLQALTPPNTSELTRMFPVLARVETFAAAPADTATALDPREVRRAATAALRHVLTGIAARGPLVLYVDDVQWGDADSAVLVRDLLAAPGAPRLLLLLAYRSEYVGTSPFLTTLASDVSGRPPIEVEVDALAPGDARALALALLDPSRPVREADADWVARESRGGALFVHELVEHLRAGGVAGAEAGTDLDAVLWARVQRLPEATRRLVEVVAVAGRPVRLDDAQAAAHLPSVPPDMLSLLRAGRFVRTMRVSARDDEVEIFHDRVRESIIARLSPETLRHHHAGLAVALELAGDADPETIAIHLEGGGDRARAGLYYGRAAEDAARVLAFDRAALLFRKAAGLVSDPAERARLHERMIHFFTDMAHFADAYEVSREAAAHYDVRLPAKFLPPLFAVEFLRSKWRLRGRSMDDLLALPVSTDARHVAAVRLMSAVAKAAYQVRPELCVAVATRIVNECLAHGNTPDCAIGYMVYGAIFQGGVLGRHRAGYDFGQLALSLVDRYANEQQQAEVCFVVGYFATSWVRPATEAEALWQRSFDAGLATNDLFHTGCAAAGTVISYHLRGVPMPDVERACQRYLEVLDRARLHESGGVVRVVRQFIRNFTARTDDRGSFSDAGFDEDAFVQALGDYGSRHFAHFYFIARMQHAYLRGDLQQAAALALRSAGYLKDSPGMLHAAEHHYQSGLIDAALGRSAGVRRAERRLGRWAVDCPANFAHKWWLLRGERARLRGRPDEALHAFEQARTAAQTYGYLQVEALADALAARVHGARGAAGERDEALGRAAGAYARWGATDIGLDQFCASSQASSGSK